MEASEKGRKIDDFHYFVHELDQLNVLRPLCSPDEKIPPASGTNQIARFVEFRPLRS